MLFRILDGQQSAAELSLMASRLLRLMMADYCCSESDGQQTTAELRTDTCNAVFIIPFTKDTI